MLQSHEEQVTRKDADISERDKNLLHLQAKVECLENESAMKDDWARKRDEAARKLEGTLRTTTSNFEAQLSKKDQEIERLNQEVRARDHEIRKKDGEIEAAKTKVRHLEDQVLFDRRRLEEIQAENRSLEQEKHLRERELQEQSEELAKFIQELDAQQQGDIPSVIKESRQAREDPENVRLKEQLAKSEADLLMVQQWQHHASAMA
ncbi:unnamed protein product [Effrenium voratum]|nr:unnamed protein product [Effrenium voratum]